MRKNRIWEILIVILNVIGILCLIYEAIPYVAHDTTIPNPDAMLPMQEWESAGILLTIGLIPLGVANLLAFFFVWKDRLKGLRRIWFFAPAMVCFVLVASYWVFSLVLM